MKPGPPQILTCPYCGEKKKIMSLMSGNTFDAVLWSDNKQIAPMLPEISLIQKCPKCGKYYFRTRQEVVYSDNQDWCSDSGLLTFPEMKEAFVQLSEEGFEDANEEKRARMMLHHAFNDYYYRVNPDASQLSEEGFVDANEERVARMILLHDFNDYNNPYNPDDRIVNDDDWSIFQENALWIIENIITDDVLKAEYYREIGMMEEALSILQNLTVEDEFIKKIADKIAKRIKKNDRKVFLIR